MKRINKIHINNFKFFPESELIEIDSKNILLYGENGSGKSSIYWALYTLLECSEKKDKTQIQKYFNKLNPDSLVNIYAPADSNGIDDSFIKVIFDDGSEFNVSHSDTSINANQNAKESLLASDFINYRLLQKAHNVKHSERVDFMQLFDEAVFNYIQFSPVSWHNAKGANIQLTSAGEIFEVIKNGPEKKYPTKKGILGYPSKTGHKTAYLEFKNLQDTFLNDLRLLLINVNKEANHILKTKLKFDIDFRLELEVLNNYKLSIAKYIKPEYRINLFIDNFNGQGKIEKPQTFLNEARLSAISLSIRMAILNQRLNDAEMKILVLDDLMISLDMSNRDKVIKLVLNDYAMSYNDVEKKWNGYQTLILTHDRSLYSFIKHDVENLEDIKRNTWKTIELYTEEDNTSGSIEKPIMFYDQNELAIAYKHFKSHDYPAAANYLRKHSEKILTDWLPVFCWKNIEKEDSHSIMNLYNIVENGINKFWDSFGLSCNEYNNLRKYIKILLNPLSHADVGVERYKEEIKNVITILNSIAELHNKYDYKTLASGGEEIQIKILDKKGNTFICTYILVDSLYVLFKNSVFLKHNDFSGKLIKYELIKKGKIIKSGDYDGNKTTMQKNHCDFVRIHKIAGSANWKDDLYKLDGSKLI